ncbi:MAG: MarR family transcriptional regulator [Verrucomicrobiales bacterium]|nr:MarR family transcriptional regulator [Verrucomicrobiales bacterium]
MDEPTDSYELNDLPFQLARSYHAFRHFAVKTLTSEGLSEQVKPGTGGLFLAIAKQEGCHVKYLSEQFQLPKATITGLLRTLESDDLVRREKDPEDARAFRLFLTGKGHELLPSMINRHHRVLETLHEGLDPEEVDELKRMLKRVLDNISRP